MWWKRLLPIVTINWAVNYPNLILQAFANEIHAVHEAIQQGLVLSAHDISEGGIAVALAEMSFKNKIGVNVDIPGDLPTDKKLFSERVDLFWKSLRKN